MVNTRAEQVNPSEPWRYFTETFRIDVAQQHLAIAHCGVNHRRKIWTARFVLDLGIKQLDAGENSLDRLALMVTESNGAGYLHEPSDNKETCRSQHRAAGDASVQMSCAANAA